MYFLRSNPIFRLTKFKITLTDMIPVLSVNTMYRGASNYILYVGTSFGSKGLGAPNAYASKFFQLSEKWGWRTSLSTDIFSTHTVMNKFVYTVNENFYLKFRCVSSFASIKSNIYRILSLQLKA